MTTRWTYGLSEMTMVPLIALGSKEMMEKKGRCAKNPPKTRGARNENRTTTRTKLLALEAALQRRWRPGYVAMWAGKRRYTSAAAEAHRRNDGPPDVESEDLRMNAHNQNMPTLAYPNGERWIPREDWAAQFRAGGLVLKGCATWSTQVCERIMQRLAGHGKQAVATYALLRRGGTKNLVKLWSWAGRAARATEERVWTHIQRAMHGRVSQIQKSRPTLQIIQGPTAASVPLFRDAWSMMQRQEDDDAGLLMRTRRGRSRKVVDAIRTDIQWQGKMGPKTACVCERFEKWIAEDWKIASEMPRHEGHVWATLDWMLSHMPAEEDERTQGGLLQWISMWRDQKEMTPLLATQPLLSDDGDAIAEAARVATQLAVLKYDTEGRQCDRNSLRGSIKKAMAAAAKNGVGRGGKKEKDEVNAEERPKMSFSDVRRHLKKRWLVCSPMDKGKHRMRYVCPVLAWRELARESEKYCEIGPYMSTPAACDMQTRWLHDIQQLHQRWKHTGMPTPPLQACPATCRTAPKSKDPMNKNRLLVGTHVTPGKRQAGIVAKAAEFMVELGMQDGLGRDQGVESLRQVRREVAAMTECLQQGCREGHYMSARKYDFVVFFQEVQRSVQKSVEDWRTLTERRYKGKKAVRIHPSAKLVCGKTHPRSGQWKPGSGYTRDNPGCEMVRATSGAAQGTYKIPTAAISEYLQMDSEVLIEIGQRIGKQQRGLTIGSCWGGTGTKLWSTHRELLHETQGIRQKRRQQCQWCGHRNVHTYETTAHGSQNTRMRLMRWVDDRWGVIAGCCHPAIRRQSRMEFLRYTALPFQVKELLADKWPTDADTDQADEGWETVVVRILAYLGTYIQQTREEVASVVGMDVRMKQGDSAIQELPAWGQVATVNTGVQLLTRPTTKDKNLLQSNGTDEQQQLSHPRLPPRRITSGSADVRRLLAATMVRFADMTQPMWGGTYEPDEETLTWWGEPWQALRREMLVQGWRPRLWIQAASMVGGG